MKTLIFISLTLLFAFFSMAEMYSKMAGSRKKGYLAALFCYVFMCLASIIEQIGSIIYNVPTP